MKKNQTVHRTPVRRTKTQAEITAQNKRKIRVAAAEEALKPNPSWDDLVGVHQSCKYLLGTVRPVASLFVNQELVTAMGDNVTKLRDLASALNKDVAEYVQVLNAIAAKHEGRTGVIDDVADMLTVWTIGDEYNQWTASFESIVVPTVRDIFALANSFLPSDQQLPTQ